MKAQPRPAPRASERELEIERQKSISRFVAERGKEGTELYQSVFLKLEPLVTRLFELTQDLLDFRPDVLASEPQLLGPARFLSAPPISEDDLDTLAGVRFKGKKTLDPELALRAAEVIQVAWDPIRFPWLNQSRRPTAQERKAAVQWTSSIRAIETLRTLRRTEASKQQEALVANVLLSAGFGENLAREPINALDDLPRQTFSRETLLGGIKCDLPVRLSDGRLLALECKVSNSATNSVKRLIREVGGKAEAWKRTYGAQIITGAVLAGVYKLTNLLEAQDRYSVTIFWEHNLKPLKDFIAPLE